MPTMVTSEPAEVRNVVVLDIERILCNAFKQLTSHGGVVGDIDLSCDLSGMIGDDANIPMV